MHRIKYAFLAVGLAVLIGCESKSPPGGPGAVKPDGTKPKVGTPDNSFRIGVADVDLKQGESKTVPVSITRGTSFDQDLKLAVDKPPQGVTIKFDDGGLKASAKETHMTVQAGADAALGEHKVTITATPAKEGSATSTEIKIEVKKP